MSYASMRQSTRRKGVRQTTLLPYGEQATLVGMTSRVPHPSEKGKQGAGTLRCLATAIVVVSPFLRSLHRTIKLYLFRVDIRKSPRLNRSTTRLFRAPIVNIRRMISEGATLPPVFASPTFTIGSLSLPYLLLFYGGRSAKYLATQPTPTHREHSRFR